MRPEPAAPALAKMMLKSEGTKQHIAGESIFARLALVKR